MQKNFYCVPFDTPLGKSLSELVEQIHSCEQAAIDYAKRYGASNYYSLPFETILAGSLSALEFKPTAENGNAVTIPEGWVEFKMHDDPNACAYVTDTPPEFDVKFMTPETKLGDIIQTSVPVADEDSDEMMTLEVTPGMIAERDRLLLPVVRVSSLMTLLKPQFKFGKPQLFVPDFFWYKEMFYVASDREFTAEGLQPCTEKLFYRRRLAMTNAR